jgi:hypothetical protein
MLRVVTLGLRQVEDRRRVMRDQVIGPGAAHSAPEAVSGEHGGPKPLLPVAVVVGEAEAGLAGHLRRGTARAARLIADPAAGVAHGEPDSGSRAGSRICAIQPILYAPIGVI